MQQVHEIKVISFKEARFVARETKNVMENLLIALYLKNIILNETSIQSPKRRATLDDGTK